MGSSFSVLNDTTEPIWVKVGVCEEAIVGSVAAVASVAAIGICGFVTCGVLIAGVVAVSKVVLVTSFVATGIAMDRMQAKRWSRIKSISAIMNMGCGSCEVFTKLAPDERERMLQFQQELKGRLAGYTRVIRGRSYTKRGTLSLVRTATVIRDDGRLLKRHCWTAPTDGGVNVYEVSRYFE